MASAEADIAPEETPGYQAPKKVDLETLKNLDSEDEALNRWKAQLLAGANADGKYHFKAMGEGNI